MTGNVWIRDTGASTHIMWSNQCTRNIHDMQLLSLGCTGGVIVSTAMIDIPGVLMAKNGDTGMWAVLKKCSYNKEHNFNLLSMSRLLNKQGWKIMCSDESLILIKN